MHNDSPKRVSLKHATVPLPNTENPRGIRPGLLALGCVVALVLLNGCASTSIQQDGTAWHYNPETGYPAVGGPTFGRF